MFWFSSKTLKKLAQYPHTFTAEQRTKIKKLFEEKTNKTIEFIQSSYYLIDGYELDYINSVISVCKSNGVVKMINTFLKLDGLEYQNGVILNNQGAFSKVTIEIKDGISIIRKKALENGIKQIKNEYRILKHLSLLSIDYNIRLVGDIVEDNSLLFEYATDSLFNYIVSKKSDIKDKISVVLRICDCIIFLHSNSILHRDLHPGNILLVNREKNGIVERKWVISDFGLSSTINDINVDRGRKSYGAPEFIAPEQRYDLSLSSIQSDVYSIGKLINFIMTGKPNNNRHLFIDITQKSTNIKIDKRYNNVFLLKQDIIVVAMAKGLIEINN